MERGKAAMLARLAALTPGVRERRPTESTWSLSDVVEHIVLAEGGMTSALAKDPSPERPRRFPPARRLRMLALRGVLLGGIRIRAPVTAILPTRELPWPELVARWDAQRERLRLWLERAQPPILSTPRFKHPIVGWMDVPQALRFAGDHLRHHFMQLGRIERGFIQSA
jgi:hypothetical protein